MLVILILVLLFYYLLVIQDIKSCAMFNPSLHYLPTVAKKGKTNFCRIINMIVMFIPIQTVMASIGLIMQSDVRGVKTFITLI